MATQDDLNQILDSIRLVPVSQITKVLGIKPQLAADWIWQDKFPIATIKMNGRNYVRLRELYDYINSQFELQNAAIKAEKNTLQKFL